jgi:hypothetical protein
MDGQLSAFAPAIVAQVRVATAGSPNEASLRHELEAILERHCRALNIPWTPFQLDRALGSAGNGVRFVDVAHGAVVIEYEAPGSFGGREGARLRQAQQQASEYTRLLQREEGRSLGEYVLVAWDGSHISFGRFDQNEPRWESLSVFDEASALRLLRVLRDDGAPLVHPWLLAQIAGPDSPIGMGLLPRLFEAVRAAAAPAEDTTSKTRLLFSEWRRLFGQVVGVQSEQLRSLLVRQGEAHGQPYDQDPAAYLFALNTYIALVAKLVAAMALPNGSQDLTHSNAPVESKMAALESGRLFADAGVTNMLTGDFFSWYLDDAHWATYAASLHTLIAHLSAIVFDVTRKDPDTTRDLFKGLYQSFVPRALRHALGEYYTPDWLAAHALDVIGWQTGDTLLDPTCGSGTFVLEALRQRLAASRNERPRAQDLLDGLYGIDLNPLAVLAARSSLVVYLAPYLDPYQPVRLPVYLADAINSATTIGGVYRHALQTERGPVTFVVPRALVASDAFFRAMMRMRDLVEAEMGAEAVVAALFREFDFSQLTADDRIALHDTVTTLLELQRAGWNGIWAAILADRFAAAAIPPVQFIVGNPPWVKWSHLPPDYAAFIKDRCLQLGVFSEDRWVGGIESDISTIVTYEAVDKWLAPGGRLAFYITGSVFSTESSEGFRRFHLRHRCLRLKVLGVEDFDALAPFEGVSNHPALLTLERDAETVYPVPYRIWQPATVDGAPQRFFRDMAEFRGQAGYEELLAQPVPGTEAGPWLKGTEADHQLWQRLFGAAQPYYRARKGVTADRNGIFFVKLLSVAQDGKTGRIQNDPSLGRQPSIAQVTALVETEHLFPLLRGRGVSALAAQPDPDYCILLPQRAMHGDPELPVTAPRTHRFLSQFRAELEARSSYRRFQRGQPYWSLWSTGSYTFSPFKVVWREISGQRFAAAYVGAYAVAGLGEKTVIPDHKLYFVPVESEEEAAYLTGLLNAPIVTHAINAYAAQLSLGVSVVEYLDIPPFDRNVLVHQRMAGLAQQITHAGRAATVDELNELNALVGELFGFRPD